MNVTDDSGRSGTWQGTIKIVTPVDISLEFDIVNTGTIRAGDMVTYRSEIKNKNTDGMVAEVLY